MAAESKGNPPAILSTHPSDKKRITKLKKYLPEALKYYKP
jgi:Zn-dependent protease with chaperone function